MNYYVLTKIGVDTAETEPLKVWEGIQFMYSFDFLAWSPVKSAHAEGNLMNDRLKPQSSIFKIGALCRPVRFLRQLATYYYRRRLCILRQRTYDDAMLDCARLYGEVSVSRTAQLIWTLQQKEGDRCIAGGPVQQRDPAEGFRCRQFCNLS